ncbi:MAG TPA: C13 family peptidase [Steroidobacteraceae bacterium]|nr:C13 family peptidase [Steroidobacteraceae bacterium]
MPAAPLPEPRGFAAALIGNLRGGVQLLALRPVRPAQFVVDFDQLAALIAVNLAIWVLLDFLHAASHAPLALDGLFGWACYLLLGLVACALIARAHSRATDTRALLVPLLAAAPGVLAVFWLAQDLALVRRHMLAASVVALIYVACLALRSLAAAYGALRAAPALLALLLVSTSPWVLELLNLDTRLWVSDQTSQAQETADDSDEAEALFYDQPARIAAAVARVTPTQPGKPGVYFVGFAGDGDQGIFRREAQFASEVFGARYGSQDRTALLINDIDDRDSYPLASLAGLTQILKALATRMNPQADVLVLFLTSHGSQDGLEVENGSLPLAQLAPTDLREALDQSGIRWRIVVVSACYAGVFIDALKTDTTAVVTAADAGHSSFGCEDDRELTWFGEAFLKDALPRSASLEAAFQQAAALIARREDSEHEIHSNPQLYIGPLMRSKLAELPVGRPEGDSHAYTVRR